MINIEDIKRRSVIDLLENYKGINPYIRNFKLEASKGNFSLTPNQVNYIIENHKREPILINRVISITPYLGEYLKKNHSLPFVPEKILFEYILAETEKAYHVFGKLKRNQSSSGMYFIPKTQVLDDPYYEKIEVNIDFNKYDAILSKYGKKLYDFQKEGIEFMVPRKGCIMGDQMGSGKTMQSIIAALETKAERILVICPASVKINWEREINVFCKDTCIVDSDSWKQAKFTIINFDILKNFHTLGDGKEEKASNPNFVLNRTLVNAKFDLIIVDEAHNIKDPSSIRGAIIRDLSIVYGIERVWLLTGTPVVNRPMDFFNLLKTIKSPIAENWKYYTERYCDGRSFWKTLKNGKKKKIWLTDGASNLDELSSKTKNILIRRLKKDTLELPDKIITPIYHSLSGPERLDYENLWEEYLIKRKEQKKRGHVDRDMVELILLRKFIALKAIPKTIEIVENALLENKKVIIFTTFTEELEILASHFSKVCVKHNGTMSERAKQNSIDKFQNDPQVTVFIGNIISAGVGITLTQATVSVFNSFSWVPGHNEQAEDRCIFGGQLIMTDEGYKKIEDIKINDMVYSHMGNFKKVIGIHSHLERKKNRVDINALGCKSSLSVTNDHEIYVYNSYDKVFEWIKAIEIDINKHMLTLKSNKQPKNRKISLEVVNYVDENFLNSYNKKQKNARLRILPKSVELTNDLLYAFGFFIAEGWTNDISIEKSSTVSVSQKIDNKKMYDAAKHIIEIIKNSFKIDEHSEYIDKHNVKTCTIHSKNLATNFISWFGKGVYNKQLPIWAEELNEEQLISLLEGYYHDDGYKRKNTQHAVTASAKLGSQLIRYNANLGKGISLMCKGSCYNIEYTKDSLLPKNKINKVGDYIVFPIKSLHISKPKRGEERVYDLSVEDDHSFVVGNYNVHNCHRIGQDEEVNIYYQLFEDSISIRMWDALTKKKDVINQILKDNVSEDAITDAIIEEIIFEYEKNN